MNLRLSIAIYFVLVFSSMILADHGEPESTAPKSISWLSSRKPLESQTSKETKATMRSTPSPSEPSSTPKPTSPSDTPTPTPTETSVIESKSSSTPPASSPPDTSSMITVTSAPQESTDSSTSSSPEPSSSSTETPETTEEPKSGPSKGGAQIGGIAVAGALGAVIIISIVAYLLRRRKRSRRIRASYSAFQPDGGHDKTTLPMLPLPASLTPGRRDGGFAAPEGGNEAADGSLQPVYTRKKMNIGQNF